MNRKCIIGIITLCMLGIMGWTMAQTLEEIQRGRHGKRSSLKTEKSQNIDKAKVLIVIGDGAEVLDTMYPFFRLAEDYQVVVAGPEKETYHLVIHQLKPGWDITEESPGYLLDSDVAFSDVKPEEYAALVLPGGRAPEYLRYDEDLLKIIKHFFAKNKPVASICHGVEILATADVIRNRKVTTIPKCRFDVQACGAEYVIDPVIQSGNLLCARGKKDMAEWMKIFTTMIKDAIRK